MKIEITIILPRAGRTLAWASIRFRPPAKRAVVRTRRLALGRQKMGRLARAHDPERGGYQFGGWQLETRRSADQLAATDCFF